MISTRVYHYRDPAAVILGLKELRKQGLTPRGLLFIALGLVLRRREAKSSATRD